LSAPGCSRQKADGLRALVIDAAAVSKRGLGYERPDQLAIQARDAWLETSGP
jgi:hypothetical protein